MANSTSQEQLQQIADTAKRFLKENHTFEERQKIVASHSGFSSELWQQMAELGWLMLPISSDCGGLDGNAEQVAALAREFGHSNFVSPFLASAVLSSRLIEWMDEKLQNAETMEQIAIGNSIVVPALYERQSRYDLANVATTAVRNGNSYLLNGRKIALAYGCVASNFLVLARTAGKQTDTSGLSFFLIPSTAENIKLKHFSRHDGSRVSELLLNDTAVSSDCLVGAENNAYSTLKRGINYANAIICSEMIGLMEYMLDITLEYVKSRSQFGQPLSSFQALQHRLVDMYMRCQLADSMSQEAIRAVDSLTGAEQDIMVAAAKLEIGRAAVMNAEEAVQLHGAMGMMDDMPIGHCLKRVFTLNLEYGDPDFHQARYRSLRK